MKKYKLVSKKGEGTFSEVVKVQNIKDGTYHAIKCMKSHFSSLKQVNNLREIQALRRLSPHPNIIRLEEVLFDQPTGRLAMVFELMDANLYDLIKGRKKKMNEKVVNGLVHQLIKSLHHMHKRGIFHRDIKPENILIDCTGKKLKLADLGSCRGIHNKQPYTEYISTRWYRAPECLLTNGYYGSEMDIWGSGCVLFELIALYPLFPGSNEIDQINQIHKMLGSPPPDLMVKMRLRGSSKSNFKFPNQRNIGISHLVPLASNNCKDLLIQTLKYDPLKRITAKDAVAHPFFFKNSPESKRIQPKGDRLLRNPNKNSSSKSLNNVQLPKLNKVPTASLKSHARVSNREVSKANRLNITNQRESERKNLGYKYDTDTQHRRRNIERTQPRKLPEIKKTSSYLQKQTHLDKQNTMYSFTSEKSTKIRNNKYNNVTSSGYGSSYNPTSLASTNSISSNKTKYMSYSGRIKGKIREEKTRLPPIK